MDLPFDKEKNQRRGFCFVNFDSSDAVESLCTKSRHPVGEKEVRGGVVVLLGVFYLLECHFYMYKHTNTHGHTKVEVKRATPQDARMGASRYGMFGRGGYGGMGRYAAYVFFYLCSFVHFCVCVFVFLCVRLSVCVCVFFMCNSMRA